MTTEDTASLLKYLEKQKSKYQLASREITELKKSLNDLQGVEAGGSANEAIQHLRNEVGTLRSRVSVLGSQSVTKNYDRRQEIVVMLR